jgi:hypothetical protein
MASTPRIQIESRWGLQSKWSSLSKGKTPDVMWRSKPRRAKSKIEFPIRRMVKMAVVEEQASGTPIL